MNARTDANAHADYTLAVVQKANPDLEEDVIALLRYLYVEAFVHGSKHQAQGDYDEAN